MFWGSINPVLGVPTFLSQEDIGWINPHLTNHTERTGYIKTRISVNIKGIAAQLQ